MYAAILNLLAKSVSNSEIAAFGMDASVACGAGGEGGGGEREVVAGGGEIDFLQVGLTILDDSLEHQVDFLFFLYDFFFDDTRWIYFFFWMTLFWMAPGGFTAGGFRGPPRNLCGKGKRSAPASRARHYAGDHLQMCC
jgi:hypothetical protein